MIHRLLFFIMKFAIIIQMEVTKILNHNTYLYILVMDHIFAYDFMITWYLQLFVYISSVHSGKSY